ncbi:MAG: DUF1552 domain-containing protein [Verrucomicrobiales bacterium]
MTNRRTFLRKLGISAAATPFLSGLPSLANAATQNSRKQRLIFFFSPNGTVPTEFWPDKPGENPAYKHILKPLEPFKNQTLLLKGVSNLVKGDGDSHMRGMSCLLTADRLLPGNIQGGGHTPAGWASNISIDQEIKKFLQSREETRTRFGSLEIGVAVPNRADPWTRMSYLGANQPVAPLDDPYQVLDRLYGQTKDREALTSILDELQGDLGRVSKRLPNEDRELLGRHMDLVRDLEKNLAAASKQGELVHPEPELDPNIELVNDNTPEISRMQMDLLVNAMANDFTRIGSLQFMRSVGQARMNWLGVQEGHHALSHEPDNNAEASEKLKKINHWFAQQLAYLAQKLRDTPEPGGDGNMLDNTTIVWINELGKGNSHTLNDLPIVLIGGGAGFKMNRYLDLGKTAHNRLWLSLAQAHGHHIDTFGEKKLCEGGALKLS